METVIATEYSAKTVRVSKKMLWGGRIMSAVPVLMLLLSCGMKLAKPGLASEGFKHLGVPDSFITGLGLLELACTVVYLIPRTAILGAILLTGYFGGAILSHLRSATQSIRMLFWVCCSGAAFICEIPECAR
jgi:hypothetical protein